MHGSSETPQAPDVLAMASLASRQDLAPRVRQALDGVLGLFWRNFERSLASTLDEFERTLIQQANKPKVGEAGARCLDSVRRMKPTRADLVPRFMLSLEDDLARFDAREAPAPERKEAVPAAPWMEMSLVGSSELDEALTLREMATKVEIRHSVPLYELGYRFGVLAGRSAYDVETLPLGPGRITSALRYAVAGLDLPLDHRIAFYQTFERFTMSGVGALYIAANTYLAEQRILRYLQVQASPKNRNADARPAARDAATPASPPRPSRGQSSDEDVAAFGLAMFEVAPSRRPPNAPGAPAATREAPASRIRAATTQPEDVAFAELRELLGERRYAQALMPTPKTADAFEPGQRELQSALAVLQVRSPPTIMLGGKVVQRTVTQLRQDLLNQLRHVTPAGQTPRVGDEDSDTIELIGLLFEQLVAATRTNGRTQGFLTRLQVPVLRVALRDKRFFFNPEHGARRLLDAVADAGTHWMDDAAAEPDPLLIERMQRAIERINAEYDTDARLFEQVAEDLLTYVGALARKAEVSERRLIEACKGREKLAMARDAASRAIGVRLAGGKATRLLRTLLEQAWTDVLALTILRQGEKSDVYRRQLAIADQLVAAGGKLQDLAAQPIAAGWREEIESGLAQVGYHDDEIQAIVDRLFAPDKVADDEHALSQTDLAIRMKSKMRLGEGAGDDPAPPLPDKPKTPLNPDEVQMLERLKALPFGASFAVNGGPADGARLKLSWSSSLTNRCLLTNQRGARHDERGLEQLARDLVAGKLKFAAAETETVAERCWKAVLVALNRFAGATRAT